MANTKEFSLASLVPEPLTFRDPETDVAHKVKTPDTFGVVDGVELEYLYQEFQASGQAMGQADASDTDAKRKAAKRMETTLDQLVQLLIPDLPAERVQQIAFGYKRAFMEWWRTETAPVVAAMVGEAKAGRPTRGRSSPASAAPTD